VSGYEIADALHSWLHFSEELAKAAKREVNTPGRPNFELIAGLREKEARAWAEFERAWSGST
jgi:hypothetical protein